MRNIFRKMFRRLGRLKRKDEHSTYSPVGDIADNILNHFFHLGAVVKKEDWDFVMGQLSENERTIRINISAEVRTKYINN